MRIICQRFYGQPKLKKPKECNNKTLLGSVKFSFGDKSSAKCKVWRYNNSIYVLHRDWFSDCIPYEEAKARGIIVSYRNTLIYKNNFGGVLLRNEAILCFDLPDMTRFILDNRFDLVKQFATMLGVEWFDLHHLQRWEDFFEEILRLVEQKSE